MVVSVGQTDSEDQTQFAAESVWCDIDTRKFYCELPDLQVFLPASYQPAQRIESVVQETVTEEALDSEIPQEELEDDGQ